MSTDVLPMERNICTHNESLSSSILNKSRRGEWHERSNIHSDITKEYGKPLSLNHCECNMFFKKLFQILNSMDKGQEQYNMIMSYYTWKSQYTWNCSWWKGQENKLIDLIYLVKEVRKLAPQLRRML